MSKETGFKGITLQYNYEDSHRIKNTAFQIVRRHIHKNKTKETDHMAKTDKSYKIRKHTIN